MGESDHPRGAAKTFSSRLATRVSSLPVVHAAQLRFDSAVDWLRVGLVDSGRPFVRDGP